jgi:hypothetical protein
MQTEYDDVEGYEYKYNGSRLVISSQDAKSRQMKQLQ